MSINQGLPTDYRLNEETQSIGDLWESIAKLAQARVVDNQRSCIYPLNIRQAQTESLESLLRAIRETHAQMAKELAEKKDAP